MSTAEEFVPVPTKEAIEAAVDNGIAAVRERLSELMGDAPEDSDAFWSDGSERANLIRVANLSILGYAKDTEPKEPPAGPVPTEVSVNAAHLTGRYVATVSIELGINYQNLHGENNGLGPAFSRYVLARMACLENATDAPRP